MELSYEDMLNCTWREFDYLLKGYNRRLERGWDYVRHIIATQYNASGFSKKVVTPTKIMKLPALDKKFSSKVKEQIPKQRVIDILRNVNTIKN